VAVLTTGANGERAGRELHFACHGQGQVDPARAAAICTEFAEVMRGQSDLTILATEDAPLTTGPGLEIRVNKASDTMLELEPTWIDRYGTRTTLPASGRNAMDIVLTETMRRALYLNILAARPDQP
jgi:hypothetical protein